MTTDASSATPESASSSIVTDSVAGVPVCGVYLLAVLVGAALLAGSVGVADVGSVEGACETADGVPSLEQAVKPTRPSKATDEIKIG